MLTLAVHLWMQSAPAVIYFISLVPLMIFIPGILADRLRTLIWLGFVVMLYFYNGVQNMAVPEPMTLDIVELLCCLAQRCFMPVLGRSTIYN